MARMQTLVDPFELAIPVTPSPRPVAPVRGAGDSEPDARRRSDPEKRPPPASDPWGRMRCWCSEE